LRPPSLTETLLSLDTLVPLSARFLGVLANRLVDTFSTISFAVDALRTFVIAFDLQLTSYQLVARHGNDGASTFLRRQNVQASAARRREGIGIKSPGRFAPVWR
jgi:hypothetical protein